MTKLVITGCGCILPGANNPLEFFRLLSREAEADPPLQHCELSSKPALRGSRLLTQAFLQATDQARLPLSARVGLVVGTTNGEFGALELLSTAISRNQLLTDGEWKSLLANRFLDSFAEQHGILGPTVLCPNVCAAGNTAIWLGRTMLLTGVADAVVVCATDPWSRLTNAGFVQIGAVSQSFPTPFGLQRDGICISEAAAAIVLEAAPTAVSRGAKSIAQLSGIGLSADAIDLTAPDPDGVGAEACIRAALSDSELTPGHVDCVIAHGTGTTLNDSMEAGAINRVFGSNGVAVTSLKGRVGHTMGAASLLEAIAAIGFIESQTIAGVGRHFVKDDECLIDLVQSNRVARIEHIVSPAYGFGGTNSCVVVSRPL